MPTGGIVARGISAEGIGVVLAGLFGTGCGTTSYSENIGAISITGVGSRAVVQCGAITMMLLSIFAKFGELFASFRSPSVHTLILNSFALLLLPPSSQVFYSQPCRMQWPRAFTASSSQ